LEMPPLSETMLPTPTPLAASTAAPKMATRDVGTSVERPKCDLRYGRLKVLW
jgi:hypothetical protein